MSTFEAAIGSLLNHEGGALTPNDNGRGACKWGITLKTYREFYPHATAEDIKAIGPEQATAFYRMAFWERYRIGLIEDQDVATKMLDLCAVEGPTPPIKILQRAVGAPADGVLGPHTAALVNAQAPAKVLEGIRTAGAQYYRELVDRRPEYQCDLEGWLARLKS